MESNDTVAKIDALAQKVDQVAVTVERIRKYLFWTFVVTIVVVVLPIVGLLLALPAFIHNYVGMLDSMSGL